MRLGRRQPNLRWRGNPDGSIERDGDVDMWQSWLAVAGAVPMALHGARRQPRRDGWTLISPLLALAGVLCWVVSIFAPVTLGHWPATLASTMLTSAAANLTLFVILCLVVREAWRLTGLVGIHSLITLIFAAMWTSNPAAATTEEIYLSPWAVTHIATALPTYALVTLAAIAAFAAFLQQSTLKQKRPSPFSRGLPSLADCDELQLRLLQIGEAVLALGLLTGMALEYVNTGHLLILNHKIVLTASAFVVIGAMLIAHQRSGLRGRRAAQLVLLGYLLLTLGYPGVKFVTDIVLASVLASGANGLG